MLKYSCHGSLRDGDAHDSASVNGLLSLPVRVLAVPSERARSVPPLLVFPREAFCHVMIQQGGPYQIPTPPHPWHTPPSVELCDSST